MATEPRQPDVPFGLSMESEHRGSRQMTRLQEIAIRQLADYDGHKPGSCFSQPDFRLTVHEAYQIRNLVARLRQQRGEVPAGYKVDDVFFQTVQLAPDRYRLYLIDPGWLDPAVCRVRVRVQLPGEFAVRDLLSNEDVPVADRSFALEVPAGALRIIDATRE